MATKPNSKLDLASIVPVKDAAPAPSAAPAADTAPAVVTTTVVKKPSVLELFGPTHTVLQQVAIHCRAGYVPSMDGFVDVYSAPGYIGLTLKLGDPDPSFVQAAAASVADAMALEQAEFNKAVAAEAARIVQAAADAEAEAKRSALIAIQKAQLAELEQQIAALTAATSA